MSAPDFGWGHPIILTELNRIKSEMFYNCLKVISQNNFVLICSDHFTFSDQMWAQNMLAKRHSQHYNLSLFVHFYDQCIDRQNQIFLLW